MCKLIKGNQYSFISLSGDSKFLSKDMKERIEN